MGSRGLLEQDKILEVIDINVRGFLGKNESLEVFDWECCVSLNFEGGYSESFGGMYNI